MTEEQQIQKGFNHGYEIQKANPELAQQLQKGLIDQDTPYAKSFAAGRQQLVKEQSADKAKTMSDYAKRIKQQYKQKGYTKDNSKSKDQSKGKGIDR